MPQRFLLDRPARVVYLAVGFLGCTHAVPALMPEGLAAVDRTAVTGWVSSTTPNRGALHRFTWLYQDEQSSKGGRGSARIAAPDSLRFDIAGSLGIGKGSAMVVGDSARWVVPERAVEELVPSYPLLWALFGVARAPSEQAALAGLVQGDRTAWRYADGVDTVEYLRTGGSPASFAAEVRQAGRVVGRATVTFRPDGSPVKARLTVPSGPAKLEITFYATLPAPSFPPDTWVAPEP